MIKRKFIPLIYLILFLINEACLITSAGKIDNINSIPIFLDQEFTLKIGQTGIFRSQNLSITFSKVISDSRCPSNVTCIWKGEIQIEVSIKYDDANLFAILTEDTNNNYYSFSNYNLTLLKVEPYPIHNQRINYSDYKATFLLTSK